MGRRFSAFYTLPRSAALHAARRERAALYVVLALAALTALPAYAGAQPNTVARAAPCETPGATEYSADGALLECNGAVDDSVKRAGINGFWAVPGVDMPIHTTATRNAQCRDVGAIARGRDGSVLVCK